MAKNHPEQDEDQDGATAAAPDLFGTPPGDERAQ
jgi:hypothetical protein